MRYLFVLIFFVCCNAPKRLQMPLSNERIQKNTNYNALHVGHDILIYSHTDSVVNAVESSVVLAVTVVDNGWSILTRGKYTIGYGNFSNVFVKKGDHIKAGLPIGIVDTSASDWFVELSIERNGKPLSAADVF